jgi:hypothetical protein
LSRIFCLLFSERSLIRGILVHEQTSIADFNKADLLMHLGFDNEYVLSDHIGLSKHWCMSKLLLPIFTNIICSCI